MSDPSRRKIILGYKEMEIKLVKIYIILLISGMILCSVLFFLFVPPGTTDQALSWYVFFWPLVYTNIFTSLMVSLLAVFLSAMARQRIVGPLYRSTKTLEQMGSGDLMVDTRLRAGDELKPFTGCLDAAAAALRMKVNATKEALAHLENQIGENAPSDLRHAVGEVRARLDEFRS